jgi:hypothetical protein
MLSTGRTNETRESFPSFAWNININEQLAVTPLNETDDRSFFFEVISYRVCEIY